MTATHAGMMKPPVQQQPGPLATEPQDGRATSSAARDIPGRKRDEERSANEERAQNREGKVAKGRDKNTTGKHAGSEMPRKNKLTNTPTNPPYPSAACGQTVGEMRKPDRSKKSAEVMELRAQLAEKTRQYERAVRPKN
jgi:hypothetical protein